MLDHVDPDGRKCLEEDWCQRRHEHVTPTSCCILKHTRLFSRRLQAAASPLKGTFSPMKTETVKVFEVPVETQQSGASLVKSR